MVKKRKSTFSRNKYLIVFLIIFFGYVGYSVFNTEIRIHELKAKEASLQDELKKLSVEKEQLLKDLEESRSLESIEKIAREKLKMVKPNEVIYVIKEEPETTNSSESKDAANNGGKK